MRRLYMPAEWEKHYGTWLSYPYNPDTFFEKIDDVRDKYVEMINLFEIITEFFVSMSTTFPSFTFWFWS
ncbi:agmatine deiminase family protein, partial [Sulfurihydrogenibium sp.]|uniref:agmatine deiminase family protein n=1 Tax=Sulfurihydrogenibium sp. TaxID=2053621 RepID=UPI0026107533